MLAEPLPLCDPVKAACLLQDEPGFLWLDGISTEHSAARMSYICVWPVDRFRACAEADAAEKLRSWLTGFQAAPIKGGAPFQGGAAGYIAYDFAHAFMPRFQSSSPPAAEAALEFGLYDTVIAFDHAQASATIYCAGISRHGSEPDLTLAAGKIARLTTKLAGAIQPVMSRPPEIQWQPVTADWQYREAVRAAQEFIRAGDIYQANIAGLWKAPPLSLAEAFLHYLFLRDENAVPFSAFGVFADRVIASLSPERLISVDAAGLVRAEPIKGTIRRGETESDDRLLREELSASEKDRAENVMIVDLLRNDLSRVCTSSSVKVTSLCRLETFTNLHHLVSTIEGELAPEHDALALLAAVFPGGSITGAPKLRAMEIIDGLEPATRGIFCGSLGWIGFDGAADFSILIRTIEHLKNEIRLWAGAGITLLSDADTEYQEICLKAEKITNQAVTPVEAS